MLFIPFILFFTKHELKSLLGRVLRVVFNDVVQTSKYYMRDVTAVESSWLVELATSLLQTGQGGATRTPALTERSAGVMLRTPSGDPLPKQIHEDIM